MDRKLKSVFGIAALVMSTQAMAKVTFYEGVGFRGRAFTTEKPVRDFQRNGFNDRASSVVVESGRWEVCEDVRFEGNCVLLRPGSYASLKQMGMNKRVSSMRPATRQSRRTMESPEPMAAADYAYRQRPQERVFDAKVTSVRAVVGPPNERCWMEREQVTAPNNNMNVGGALIGAILGGVLGHQVGEGTGKQVATVGGAVAGGAIGSQVGRNNESANREVRRCENLASTTPEFWDVTYDFRGKQHRIQMSAPPGPTIAVNRDGEPRQ